MSHYLGRSTVDATGACRIYLYPANITALMAPRGSIPIPVAPSPRPSA